MTRETSPGVAATAMVVGTDGLQRVGILHKTSRGDAIDIGPEREACYWNCRPGCQKLNVYVVVEPDTEVPEVGTDEWRTFVEGHGGFRNDGDEPVNDRLAAIFHCHRWAEAAVRAHRLEQAVLDIDAHARPLAEDADGFVTGGYLISVGSLHRALGLTGTAARCRECPHEAAHFTTATAWNDPIDSDDCGRPDAEA